MVTGVLVSSVGWTQTAEDPEVLIRNGVALRRLGHNAKAHGYFRRAYEIARTPRTAAQLGLCDLSLQYWLEADVHLTEALSTSDPWIAAEKDTLERSRETARARLGRIQIDGAAPDTTVTASGRPPMRLPAGGDVWVAPGAVRLKLEAPGHAPLEREVTVAAGAVAAIRVTMTPMPPAVSSSDPAASAAGADRSVARSAPPVSSTPADTGAAAVEDRGAVAAPRWKSPVVWTAAGLAAGLVGLGVYQHLRHDSLVDEFNDPRRTPWCRDGGPGMVTGGADCERLASSGDRARTFAIVGYVGGGVLALAAVGIQLLVRSPDGVAMSRSRTIEVSCAAAPAPGGGGAACALIF
jgi:hypothetical protein